VALQRPLTNENRERELETKAIWPCEGEGRGGGGEEGSYRWLRQSYRHPCTGTHVGTNREIPYDHNG